jgi:hypothetical protein
VGNQLTLLIRPGTADEPPAVTAAAAEDLTAVTGTWDVQNVLPFLWVGLVPTAAWDAHVARLRTAVEHEDEPGASVTDVVVDWRDARGAFERRLTAVAAAWPEVDEPARAFLDDVASVAERTEHAVVHLALDQLVAMSWGDAEDVEQYVDEVRREASNWDEPSAGSPASPLTDLASALTLAEPDRSFLLGGEWTFGGSPAPRSRPPLLPAASALTVEADAPVTPPVATPGVTASGPRYDAHGDDRWEAAALREAQRRQERLVSLAATPAWWWMVPVSLISGVAGVLLAAAVTQQTAVALGVGAAVALAVWVPWGLRRRALDRLLDEDVPPTP